MTGNTDFVSERRGNALGVRRFAGKPLFNGKSSH